jgi:hypothetical protein
MEILGTTFLLQVVLPYLNDKLQTWHKHDAKDLQHTPPSSLLQKIRRISLRSYPFIQTVIKGWWGIRIGLLWLLINAYVVTRMFIIIKPGWMHCFFVLESSIFLMWAPYNGPTWGGGGGGRNICISMHVLRAFFMNGFINFGDGEEEGGIYAFQCTF